MLVLRPNASFILCCEPIDLRKHFNGLWGLVSERLKKNALSGDVFIFLSKSRRRLKALWWDGTGLVILCKRMDRGLFPAPWDTVKEPAQWLSHAEWALLLEGHPDVGRKRISPAPWTPGEAR